MGKSLFPLLCINLSSSPACKKRGQYFSFYDSNTMTKLVLKNILWHPSLILAVLIRIMLILDWCKDKSFSCNNYHHDWDKKKRSLLKIIFVAFLLLPLPHCVSPLPCSLAFFHYECLCTGLYGIEHTHPHLFVYLKIIH